MREMSSHSIERFRAVTARISGVPTDHIVDLLDKAGFWDPEVLAQVAADYKRQFVRKMLGRVTNDDGQRLFVNVEVSDPKGRRMRVYKNRGQMSVDDFRQAVDYYTKMGARGVAMAKQLARDCRSLHGVQLRLSFRAA